MSMIKRGTTKSSVIVAKSVFVCDKCGHTLVNNDSDTTDSCKCPSCGEPMTIVSASATQSDD